MTPARPTDPSRSTSPPDEAVGGPTGPRSPGSRSPGSRSSFGTVAAVVCGLEGLALLGFCGFYLYELVLGEGEPARVVMSVVLMGLVAIGLLAMARGWLRGLAWPRTPTILWNLLLLPVAWSMLGAGFWGAWPLGLIALAAIVAAWRSPLGESTDTVL